MKTKYILQQGRGGALPGWCIEVFQIAVAILITVITDFVLIQYGAR